ncbi:hypothetical protein MRX96_000526 [Rhipicephalus microplus]
MQQECSALLDEQLNGRLLVYVDGSALRDSFAATACIVLSVCTVHKCRLSSLASSTVAELAATNVAADFLASGHPPAQQPSSVTPGRPWPRSRLRKMAASFHREFPGSYTPCSKRAATFN